MIRLTLTDWTDTEMTELKALFDFAQSKGYDVKLSFENVEELD